MDKRTARGQAMKLVYEWEMGGDGGEETLTGLLEVQPGEEESDFMMRLFEGVKENTEAIDEKIGAYAKGWTVDRIAKVDLAILRLAVYEILFSITPAPIAVNEAVELAKAYSTDRAGGFINGILGNFVRGMNDAQ